MLRREAVVDARDGEAGLLGEEREAHILEIGCAERPAAAVQMQVDAARLVRREHAHAHAVGVEPARLGEEHRRREDAAPLVARAPRRLDRNGLEPGSVASNARAAR